VKPRTQHQVVQTDSRFSVFGYYTRECGLVCTDIDPSWYNLYIADRNLYATFIPGDPAVDCARESVWHLWVRAGVSAPHL